jgi:hypothetical protein
MRKIISLGLFALMLSIFSSQVFAGKVAVCEHQKDQLKSLGLYGLCNAYWNADEDKSQEGILNNYNMRALELGGPPMPGLSECPCWSADELLDAACNMDLGLYSIVNSIANFASLDGQNVQFAAFALNNTCGYLNLHSVPADSRLLDTSSEENLTCRAGIVSLVVGDFLSECPYP